MNITSNPKVLLIAGVVLMVIGIGDLLSSLLTARVAGRTRTFTYLLLLSAIITFVLGLGLVLVAVLRR